MIAESIAAADRILSDEEASMRPRFSDRGKYDGRPKYVSSYAASMRPRFSDRGKRNAWNSVDGWRDCFNEAAIQ